MHEERESSASGNKEDKRGAAPSRLLLQRINAEL